MRTVHAIAARFGAGVEATVARVRLVRRSIAPAAVAVVATAEPAVAIGIPNPASRTTRALAQSIGTAVHVAFARIGIVGVTAVDKARRGTARAMAFLRTSSAPAKRAAASFARTLTHGLRRVAVRTTALAGFALAVRAARRVGSHVAVAAALVGRGVVALARSAAEALRPVPVLATGAAAEPDFTPVARRAIGSGARRPPGVVDDAPAVKVTLAGGPAWARQLRTGPALAIALSLTIGLSLGLLLLLLSMRPSAPRTAGATLAEISPSPTAAVVSPVVQEPSRPVSPALVRAIWAKSDTRSLDSGVRRAQERPAGLAPVRPAADVGQSGRRPLRRDP